MRRFLVALVLALTFTGTAQAHLAGITAPTPGLQIVQLRSEISHDIYAIQHGYRETTGARSHGWVQIVRVFIAKNVIAEHTRHYMWASRQLQRRWALLGNVRAWTCIHGKEGSWADAYDPFWGGLQMDRGFQRTYGSDMLAAYGGYANVWHPYDQIIVAQRAYRSGRGYYPWPNTARACGLI